MEWHCQTQRAMTVDDFRNLVIVFPTPGQSGFHMGRARGTTRLIDDNDPPSRRSWMWVSTDAFGEAPLRFGRMADFLADEGVTELAFVKEILGMFEACKASKRFRSPEIMALTGWFPSFTAGSEEALRADRLPSPEATPAGPISRGTLLFQIPCIS